MEKKTIFLQLPADIVDEIDRQNIMGDRSEFILNLLRKQLKKKQKDIAETDEFISKMESKPSYFGISNEIKIFNQKVNNLGSFNINTVEGLKKLAETIDKISDDPLVKLRAKRLL
jgi:flagellar motility protein MotE (MotC chaperone)